MHAGFIPAQENNEQTKLVHEDTFRTRHTFTKYTNYTFLGFDIILVLDIVICMGSEKRLYIIINKSLVLKAHISAMFGLFGYNNSISIIQNCSHTSPNAEGHLCQDSFGFCVVKSVPI